MAGENLSLHGRVHITAWEICPDYPDCRCMDIEIKNSYGNNLLVDTGRDTILRGIGGSSLMCFGITAAIGTGTSATAAAVGQTDLLGTCKAWIDIPGACKVYVRPTLFISADFGFSCNNWTWNELGLADDQGTPCNDPACCSLMIARQVDGTPLVKTCTKRAIVEWQLTL